MESEYALLPIKDFLAEKNSTLFSTSGESRVVRMEFITLLFYKEIFQGKVFMLPAAPSTSVIIGLFATTPSQLHI